MNVVKFGGSSNTLPEDITRIRRILDDDPNRTVTVISAPGITPTFGEKKTTDLLKELSDNQTQTIIDQIKDRYQRLYPGMDLFGLEERLQTRLNIEQPDKRRAALMATGEEQSAMMLAKAVNGEYVDPKEIFVLSHNYVDAEVRKPSYSKIRKRLQHAKRAIVPGFFGYTKQGEMVTFSRGGSDLTGGEIAGALNAKVYENFTDVDGVRAADPRIVPNPKKIEYLTYREMRDLSYGGSSVLHQKAMEACNKAGVHIHIRNTFKYPEQGTLIVPERIADSPVIGIAYKNGFCSFNLDQFCMNEQEGVLEKMTGVFRRKKISIEYAISSIDDISVIVHKNQLIKNYPNQIIADQIITDQIIKVLEKKFPLGEIDFQDNLASVAIAGKGLEGSIGLLGKCITALTDENINVAYLTQSAGERCIIIGVKNQDGHNAVRALYSKFFGK